MELLKVNDDPKFYSDLAERIIKIVEIKLIEKPVYRDDEIIFHAHNGDNKAAPPIEMTKADIKIILKDLREPLKNDMLNYLPMIKKIDKTLNKLK